MTNSDSTPKIIIVPITLGYCCVISPEDADLAKVKWCTRLNSITGDPYAQRGYYTARGLRPVPMHRLILERILGRSLVEGETVDHANANTLDNRRSNLRLADHTLNARNSKRRRDNSSGYKGVGWSKVSNKWRAYGRLNGKQIHLGLFDDPKEAHEAYKEFAREHYGEFARFE